MHALKAMSFTIMVYLKKKNWKSRTNSWFKSAEHELMLLTAELLSLRERVKPTWEVSTHGLMASTVNLVDLVPFFRALVPYTGMGHLPWQF